MEIKIRKDERSCRNCKKFNYTTTCWKNKDECGEGLPEFEKKSTK